MVCTNKKAIRRNLGLPCDANIIIYTGQFIKRKNVDFALEAFSYGFNDNDGLFFVLLGDGPELNRLKTRYSSFDNIQFVGQKTNVQEYLHASDVFLSASKSEGLPNSVLEAISCGLPVLLSDIPQHKEILDGGGKCGYSFPLDDCRHLAHLMKKLISNDDIDALSKAARKTAECYFSSMAMCKNYQDVYLGIINNKLYQKH